VGNLIGMTSAGLWLFLNSMSFDQQQYATALQNLTYSLLKGMQFQMMQLPLLSQTGWIQMAMRLEPLQQTKKTPKSALQMC
jgi:hypothetical protein